MTGLSLAQRFARDGFAVIPELVGGADLRALQAAAEIVLDLAPHSRGDRLLGGLTRQVMAPERCHETFADNAALTAARALAADLTGCSDPQFVFSMLIDKPPHHPHATPWHQDFSYALKPAVPPGRVLANDTVVQFWVALDDVTADMGCMEFLPGAFKAPLAEHRVAAGDPDDDGRLLAIADAGRHFDLSAAVACPLSAGSASVHGYLTPHYTGPNRTDRRRRAYIFSLADPLRLARAMTDLAMLAQEARRPGAARP